MGTETDPASGGRTDEQDTRLSRFLSLVLRHQPSAAGVSLDGHGWADVDALLKGVSSTGRRIDKETLDRIVATDDKQRYAFNEDGTRIRARQGHSIPIDVGFKEGRPPDILYHGTGRRFIDSILREGIVSKQRLYVHLSTDVDTATKVGSRHGDPVVLVVDAARMLTDGHKFWLSENGVWQCETVPVGYFHTFQPSA